jgi:predicted amidohydrolase/GNAT superfamily N-acetyltransferase
VDRVRVASLQYFIRPVRGFHEFREQVHGLVHTAADYQCRLLVFPEYFSVQLLTLGDLERPMDEQVRALARRAPEFVDMMAEFARDSGMYIAAGTIPVLDEKNSDRVYNDAYFFAPDGSYGVQGKMHMTRFEKAAWRVTPRDRLNVFDTEFGRVAIAICYDVEFPEVVRAAARENVTILLVPSYTDDRQAFLRVRYCAHARAIENQMFVITSATVGSLPMVPAVSLNYGQAAILTPSDFPFARDGILAEGLPNQETMVIGELNLQVLRSNRAHGSVTPLRDSRDSARIASRVDIVPVPSARAFQAPPPRPRRKVKIRNMQESDFDGIRDLARLIYPDIDPWTDDQLREHLERFPQGQFVVVEEETGLIVGYCSGLVVDWDRYDETMDWRSLTAGGSYANHDPVNGKTLFAADVMVRPGMQGRGIGKRLYKAGRFAIAKQLGLKRVLAGARLRGYHGYADTMSAEDYVVEVVNGRLKDPTLSFQLSQGFRVLGVVADYFKGDSESRGYAAVIEWLNDGVATEEDYEQGDPRFRPPPRRGAAAKT